MPPPDQFPLPGIGASVPVLRVTREETMAPETSEHHHGRTADPVPKSHVDLVATSMGADIEAPVSVE
jgi:hypothetical protein